MGVAGKPSRWQSKGSLENLSMPVNHSNLLRKSLVAHLTRWVLPARCLACGEAAHKIDLCAACIATLPRSQPACPRCALPLPTEAPACGFCLQHPPPFSRLCTAWRYEGVITHLLPRFKFHRDLAAGRVLAELAVREWDGWDGWLGVDRLIPMPLHVARLGQRGYNQALELARPIARSRRLPVDLTSLIRQRATTPQTELDAAARRRNLRGAFVATDVSGQTVLLLDDVVTTAATVREAARTLLRAGASEVRVLAIARAPEPDQR